MKRRRTCVPAAMSLKLLFPPIAPTASVGLESVEMAPVAAGARGVGEASESSSSSDSEEVTGGERQRTLTRRSKRRARNYVAHCLGRSISLSHLETRAVSGAVGKTYEDKLESFMNWTLSEKLALTTDSQVDLAFVKYLNSLYFSGASPSVGEKSLAGFLHRFQAFGKRGSRRLPRAWRCITGWRKAVPARSRLPLPWMVWAAVATELVRLGHRLMAVHVLLMVALYLRPGEALLIRREDLLPPMTGISPFWTVLLCPSWRQERTKTGDSDESLRVDTPSLKWLGRVLSVLRGDGGKERVFDYDYPMFARNFQTAVSNISVGPLVPYQGRHSGASIDRCSGRRTVEEVRKRGRWKSHRSVVRYEKSGLLQASALRLGPATIEVCRRREVELSDVMLGRRAAV
jgi:integrase